MKSVATFARALVVLCALALLPASAAAQGTYPNKPIRLIVPFAAGSGTNSLARLLAQKLEERLGQPVIVDNRPGGDTIIGTEAAAKAPPDGYTLLLTATALIIVPLTHRTVPYDAFNDFIPVATLASGEQLLVIHPSVPANTLGEFVAYAKSRPGGLNYASAGNGTTNHLASEQFNIQAGVKIQHIPYQGGGPSLAAILGGHVQVFFNSPLSLIAHVKSGKVKPIAISGPTRSPALPQVPTFTEAGLPNFDVRFWYGLLAPAQTPRPIVEKLSSEITKIIETPEYKEVLAGQGVAPFLSTPEQFAALLQKETAAYKRIIELAKIEPEN